MLQYLVFIGAAAQLIGIFYYLRGTIRGEIKPNKVTWLMWAIAPLIATAAALADGVGLAVLPVFLVGFGPLLIFAASFVNPGAYWKLERFDYACGAFSVLALALWAITKEPLVAIVFSILSDGFAAVPTIIKSWKRPETESVAFYLASIFSVFTAFFSLKTFNFAELAFPLYLLFINSVLTFAYYKSRFKNHNNH